MARQPKRSAFVLTFNLNTIYKIVITVILCISSVRANNNNKNNNFSSVVSISDNSGLTTSVQQPKFGDRLLPRHRHFGTTINQTNIANNSISVNKIFDNSISISNSNSNSSNDSTSYKILIPSVTDDQYLKISEDHSSGVKSSNSSDQILKRSDLIKLPNSSSSSSSSNKNNDFAPLINNAVIPVKQAHARMQKLRRNDYDIEIDHDHDLTIDHINISKADRLIEMSTEFFIVPSSTTVNPDVGHQRSNNQHVQQQNRASTTRSVLILAPRTISPNISAVTPPTIISTTTSINYIGGLRKEPWVVPVLVLAALCMIMMAAFEIFVLFKAWRTSPSRRHLFLGQMLLLGLFGCAGLGAVLTATPTIVSCATVRFGVGVAYALVFAALLVKCVFLISLNGGVYLPAPYQGLLLLFAVLIQVAIGAQWLVTQPPDIHTISVPLSPELGGKFSMLITSTDITRLHGSAVLTLCKTQFSEILLSLIYIIFLIIFVAILAIKSRGIRDNYREATYIGLAIGGAIPIWIGWALCGLAVTDRHKDACLAFGLVATSATVFLVMFMPKGRQLAAMGKEGLYVEDREEQFSSLSRAGSGYSPSFFHFKPIKYGVMGGVPNSTTNTGNGTNSKHAATLGGDRVALVAAAPPSYTRMYHYFPAHMTHPFCFYPTPPPQPPPPLSPPLPPLKAIGSQQSSTTAQLAQTIRYPGLFMRPDETNLYTTLEPTLSTNPNVYFQRSGGVHPGMMY